MRQSGQHAVRCCRPTQYIHPVLLNTQSSNPTTLRRALAHPANPIHPHTNGRVRDHPQRSALLLLVVKRPNKLMSRAHCELATYHFVTRSSLRVGGAAPPAREPRGVTNLVRHHSRKQLKSRFISQAAHFSVIEVYMYVLRGRGKYVI